VVAAASIRRERELFSLVFLEDAQRRSLAKRGKQAGRAREREREREREGEDCRAINECRSAWSVLQAAGNKIRWNKIFSSLNENSQDKKPSCSLAGAV